MATFYELCQEAIASIDAGSPNRIAVDVYDCFRMAEGPGGEVGWRYTRAMLELAEPDTKTFEELNVDELASGISLAHDIDGETAVLEALSIVNDHVAGM